MTINPRTCVGCRRRDITDNLVRVVERDGAIVRDTARCLPGRGAWIHPDPACLSRAERSRAFGRALRTQPNVDITQLETDPTWSNPAPGVEESKGWNPMGTR